MSRSAAAALVLTLACGTSRAPDTTKAASPSQPAAAAAPGAACPANGLWAECSLVYRLERAGLAPKPDSGAKPDDEKLGGSPLMLKIGLTARLEVHLYPDSTARIAAGRSLDRAQFVNGTQEQTIKRERTLIESANVIALLTSINSHQRERVSDAITAGPPQPGEAQPLTPQRVSP